MALNVLTPNTDFVQKTAEARRIIKTLVADFTFDFFCNHHRNKVFLSRNMTKVLAYHERNRTRGLESLLRTRGPFLDDTPATKKPVVNDIIGNGATTPKNRQTAGGQDMSDDQMSSGAKPDVESMSQDCLRVKAQTGTPSEPSSQKRRSVRHQLLRQHEDKNAQLYFDVVNIRKKLNFKEGPVDGDQRPRKRIRRESIPCHCHITIWDNRQGLEQKEPIVRKSEMCEVSASDMGQAGFSADIQLRNPFVFRSSELMIPLKTPRGTVLGIGDQYFLEIKIIPTKDDVDWPPVPILGRSEGDQTTGLGRMAAEKLQGSLVARYLHLPHAPASEVPLSVFYLHESRTYRSKYGLEVRAEWTKGEMPEIMLKHEENDTTIDLWALDDGGRAFGRKDSPKGRTKPTSKSSPPVKVTFNLDAAAAKGAKDFRKANVNGLRCPACPKLNFESVQDLQFHFMTLHSKYKFTIEKEDFDESTKSLVAITFKIAPVGTIRPRNYDRDPKPRDKDLDWQAPKEPLNIHAYVNGNQDWVDQHWTEGQPKATDPVVPPVVVVPDPVSLIRQKEESGFAPAQKGGFLPADHVLPFRQPARKKYPTIKLRTMTREKEVMYTSVSHRQVQTGEDARSESDDEMDDKWYIQKSLEALDVAAEKQGWTDEERLLRRKWNQARLTERLSHPRYLSDCLIRFVRAEKPWLVGGEVERKSTFTQFLDDFLQRRVINQGVIRDIWMILHNDDAVESSKDTSVINGPPQGGGNTVNDKPASRPLLPPGLTPREIRAETMLRLPLYTCAICVKAIDELSRHGLRCSEHECEAPGVWYHNSCVRCKRKDKFFWKCSLCIERIETTTQSTGKEIAMQ